jgi:hypothetical protein
MVLQPVTLGKKHSRHKPKWFADIGRTPKKCDTNTVTKASTIRTERTNDAYASSVAVTAKKTINEILHEQTINDIVSTTVGYVQLPCVFTHTPKDADEKDEFIQELDQKLTYDKPKENPICTIPLPPKLTPRAVKI